MKKMKGIVEQVPIFACDWIMAGRMEVGKMMIETCGKVAKYRAKYGGKLKIDLCIRHFSNQHVQYLITRKWVTYEQLEDGEAKCQAEVERREPIIAEPRAEKRVLYR